MSDIPTTVEDMPLAAIHDGEDENDDHDKKIAATYDQHGENLATANTDMEEEISETIHLTSDQQMIYNAAHVALNESLSEFLPAPIPKVVSVELIQPLLMQSTKQDSTTPSVVQTINQTLTGSTTTPIPATLSPGDLTTFDIRPTSLPILNRSGGIGHRNEMLAALDELEGLEKEEQTLATKTPLTRYLTELLTGQTYENSAMAIKSLDALEEAVPRRVCQHPFRKNDIVWVCRTCQADETCVLCHTCFSQSNHDGHDVAFYHAQAGGCCDCGDPDAWNPNGFCPRHGPNASVASESSLPNLFLHRVRGVVPACIDWMVQTIATNAETAYERANPIITKKRTTPTQNRPGHAEGAPASDALSATILIASMTPLTQPIDVDQNDNDIAMNDDVDDVAVLAQHQEEDNRNQLMNDIYVDEYDFVLDEHFPRNNNDQQNNRNHMMHHRSHVFSPMAASNSQQSIVTRQEQEEATAAAIALGNTGRLGNGLYIVLHADDIHSSQQFLEALKDFYGVNKSYGDSLIQKLVRALRLYGQLVVWGTMELAQECGITQVHLWMDGDKVAAGRVGAIVLELAGRLRQHGIFCSILTRDELILEQRAVAVLQWLSCVARSCDPLCLTVAECILPNRHLVPLLRADFKMSARVTKAWYSLLLTLLAVPTFKSHLAAAYCDTYRDVTSKYARGMGVLERSGYTLSVQFLNRVTYVLDLVQGRDLLGKLGKSLFETLAVAVRPHSFGDRLDPNHFILTHRRYSPCISDFKCVLNVDGMSRVIAARRGTFLTDWIATLSLAQFMDAHKWRHWTLGHVEDESRGWVGAFNLSISLGGLFERILCWTDETLSPIREGPLSGDLMSCVELTFHLLTTGIDQWHRKEKPLYTSIPVDLVHESYNRALATLPFSSISASFGTVLDMTQLPVSQATPFSFHLPLHRFFASCIRELCLRRNKNSGDIADLFKRLTSILSAEQHESLFEGLMEFPVLVLSRAAQIRAGLWRRNGTGLNDQVLNYAEPPFCRHMRDADILLVQFATVCRRATVDRNEITRPSTDIGMSYFVNLLLHRFELFHFLGFTEAQCLDSPRVTQDPDGLYEDDKNGDRLLSTLYSPARDAGLLMSLLDEFLHVIIMFVSELPPIVPLDRGEQTQQAKLRLFREVVHRLASGPKTHSELSEVHHVLSHWDNFLLSEEGKLVNPDDATGAALATTLDEVAERKVSRGKMEPDKWELKCSAWESYDPAFFHISLRSHQTAATEGRPKPTEDLNAPFGWQSKPYAPVPIKAHPFFARLRRDATSDATLIATAYKVLHIHCRINIDKSVTELRGKLLYESGERSETALARAIHFFTLGAYSWMNVLTSKCGESTWRESGGGSVGSIFFDSADGVGPDAAAWVKACLLAEPSELLDCPWYDGEEKALILLERLATGSGLAGGFVAQDSAVRAGAAWLCEFALSCCPEARMVLKPVKNTSSHPISPTKVKNSEMEMRKQAAKDKAMAKMKAQAAKFSAMLEVDVGSDNDSDHNTGKDMSISAPSTPGTPHRAMRLTSFGSTFSSVSNFELRDTTGSVPNSIVLNEPGVDDSPVPLRLLKNRPRCIICNDEDGVEGRLFAKSDDDDGEGQRKKSRRRTENALGFVGYAQASVVLKGGGGPPPELGSPYSSVYEFVGTHVALCGHAVHSECCESYLATVSHREDRQIGKRDEFRCPLCQRLSNCLMPFIDVGMDWIESPSLHNNIKNSEPELQTNVVSSDEKMKFHAENPLSSLHEFLQTTPWWVSCRNKNVVWDGHSAFVESAPSNTTDDEISVRKPSRIRSLRKKDLYQAWNAMMHTPRFVRRKLRRSSSRSVNTENDSRPIPFPSGEESIGETVVWRRFMDQISDISYRADTKRLGDDHLHNLFGEFRHYIVEKYAYSTRRPVEIGESTDWPACLFKEPLSENRRQEMSREKLMSKLLLSIQAFTYSCSSEAFEAKRSYRKSLMLHTDVTKKSNDSSAESVRSRFGFRDLVCRGKMILMPIPSHDEDGDAWPFDGRLGKLRYFGLTVMAASGAVAADLVQLVLPFPFTKKVDPESVGGSVENPPRAPIAYPFLFGNVITHVVAAMCATCGRARARSDLLDVVWPIPFSIRGSFAFLDLDGNSKNVDSVVEDCEGFIKLGLIARILQVLLGKLLPGTSISQLNSSWLNDLTTTIMSADGNPTIALDLQWIRTCMKLIELTLSHKYFDTPNKLSTESTTASSIDFDQLHEICALAAFEAGSYLVEVGTIFQILVPGAAAKFTTNEPDEAEHCEMSPVSNLQFILSFFHFESVDAMIDSASLQEIVTGWYDAVYDHTELSMERDGDHADLYSRLYRTQGFRVYDWPTAYAREQHLIATEIQSIGKVSSKSRFEVQQQQPQDDGSSSPQSRVPLIANLESQNANPSITDILRSEMSPSLLTFQSKKCVSLLGGFSPDLLRNSKLNQSPRVSVIPTSYTDLYAELASLMPDCEQTAVCLVCGEVLNAGGRGECTKHSFKCGAGAGIFFLLQECSGLLLHKARAAYIHSPYVDSHGETPQYRGRPLNLDVDRYEHLREVWYSHGVRQKVLAERGMARQVILPDYY